jgi:beta-glucanase (GH16 family)
MKPFIPSIRSLHRCSIAACVGVVFISLSAAAQIYGPPSSNPFYTLRWNETFTGAGGATQSAVNPRDWMWLMGVGSYSTQLPANVSQDSSSNLDIADTEVVAGATYTGGGVISQPTFRFGYFQVRAWTPPSVTGWLTTFSLNGGANAIESWNRRALPAKFTEIDGFNIDSSNPTQMSSGVTSWTGSTATPALCSGGYTNIYNSSPTTPPGPPIDSSAGWHTYGIEWTEGNVAYYVDDYPICSQTYNPATSAASPVNMLLTSIANDASVAGSGKVQFANPQYYVQNYYVNPEDTGYAEYGSGWGVSGVAGFSSQPVRYSCSTSATASSCRDL